MAISATSTSSLTASRLPKLVGQGHNKLVFECRDDPSKVIYLAKNYFSSSLEEEYKTVKELKKAADKFRESKELKDTQKLTDFWAIDWERTENISGKVTFRASRAYADLDKYLREEKLSLNDRLSLGKDLLTSVKFLHAAHKCHGDLKPDNALVYKEKNEKVVAKLADFGKTISCGSKKERFFTYGNQYYSAPERSVSQEGEVYSTGLILLRILEEKTVSKVSKDRVLNPGNKGIVKLLEQSRKISNFVGKLFYRLISFFYYLFKVEQGKNPKELTRHIKHVMKDLENEAPHNLAWCGAIQQLHQLIFEMTRENPSERPDAAKALGRYEEIQKSLIAARRKHFF